jgi:hypothetical protein
VERRPPSGDHDRASREHRAKGDGSGDVRRLEEDIQNIRGNLGGLLGELDHRRHEAFDVRVQLRRHGLLIGLGLFAMAGVVTSAVLIHRERSRRRRSLPVRLRGLRQALRRMAAEPERVVESQPRVRNRILVAAGTAVASVMGRRLAERIVRRR